MRVERSLLTAVAAAVVAWSVACSGPGAAPTAAKDRFSEDSPCMHSLHQALEQLKRSQRMQCSSDSDCALVTNPATPDPHRRVAVHRTDKDRLDQEARQHLDRCGAFKRPEPADERADLRARCMQQRCREAVSGYDIAE